MAQRITKPPEERQAEILKAASHVFAAKGYTRASVQDIIDEVGIAKGTFYYHFDTKEAALDALIDRQIEAGLVIADEIVQLEGVPAVDKLIMFLASQRESAKSDGLVDHIEEAFDMTAHLRSMSRTIVATSPHLVPIVEQGIAEGSMRTDHPLETIDLILGGAALLFDSGFIERPHDDPNQKLAAFLSNVESLLQIEPGKFAALFSAPPPEKA